MVCPTRVGMYRIAERRLLYMKKQKILSIFTAPLRFLLFFVFSFLKNVVTAVFAPVVTIVLTIFDSGRLTSDFVFSIVKTALPVAGYFAYRPALLWMLAAFVLFESVRAVASAVFLTRAWQYGERERRYRQTDEYRQREEAERERFREEYRKQEERKCTTASQGTGGGMFSGLSAGEAKRKYRKLVKKYHPDNGGDKNAMQKIMDEYEQYLQTAR